MTKNGNYESPRVFSQVELCLETSILQTSIVEFIGKVESTGQHVQDFE